MANITRFAVIALPLSLIHFAVTWVSFMRSAVIKADESTSSWRAAAEVLAFPLVYLQGLDVGFDPFPVLLILNSVLWGSIVAAIVVWTIGKWRK